MTRCAAARRSREYGNGAPGGEYRNGALQRGGKDAEGLHELGILMSVIKTVENYAAENQVGKIEKLVLLIGEISSVIPEYMRKVYPAAVEDTLLADARLEIEILPANAECRDCGSVFHATVTGGVCPECGSRNMHLISGRDFFIKEIVCSG